MVHPSQHFSELITCLLFQYATLHSHSHCSLNSPVSIPQHMIEMGVEMKMTIPRSTDVCTTHYCTILLGRAKRSPSLLGGAKPEAMVRRNRMVRPSKPDGTTVRRGGAYHLHVTGQPLNPRRRVLQRSLLTPRN